jgi:nicotinamide mononucleotide adenylyltransferase
MKCEIVPIDKLLPLEKVFHSHLKNLEEMIDNDGFILKAIIVDKKTGTILDGSHRYVYFLKKGYKEVPVYYTDYDDEDIRVGTRLSHRFFIDGDTGISKKECRERALSGNIFYPRTTRHFFTFRKNDISINLNQLAKGDPVDVSHLIADVDMAEEIAHNEEYIKEIGEEVEFIVNYLSEVSQTKKYLTKQIALMKESRKIAFLPGKFHPPHIGHILTILNVLPKYKKLIIGVTEDAPTEKVTTAKDIVDTLNLFFKSFDNAEVMLIKGVLTEKKNLDGLPEFDVLLSGNEKVLDWAKHNEANPIFIPRSDGFLCSGTEIRSVLKENDNE